MIYKHIIAVTTGNLFIKVMAFRGKYFVTKLQGKEIDVLLNQWK